MKKRILALFLVAAMAVGMLPTALAVRLDEVPETPAEDAAVRALPAVEDQGAVLAADEGSINLAQLSGVTVDDYGVNEVNNQGDGKKLDGAAAIDGIKTNADNVSKPSGHWSTPENPSKPVNLTVDLHRMCTVDSVKLFWKHDAVTAYTVQVSSDGNDWTTIGSKSERVSEDAAGEEIVPASPQQNVRYVKLSVTNYDNQGSAGWANVNLWEIEIYGVAGELIANASTILDLITSSESAFAIQGGSTLIVNPDLGVPAGYTVSLGANLEQVVGTDGTIYTPVVNKQVALDVTVVNNNDPSDTASTAADTPILVTIPGSHEANEGNAKPAVIPEIMEWYSSAAQDGEKFTLTANSRIVAPAELNGVANEVKADVQDLFGLELLVVSGSPRAGDVVLTLGSGAQVAGFDDETYRMEVTDRVIVTAKAAQGAYWATRTLLQGLKLSGEERSFPQGSMRDYPEFKVRGFVLDAGRKPMSMDMLKTIAKNMAWYKLNDFHVHLNDNLIWLEDYYNDGETYQDDEAWERINEQAYAAFRLQSDIANLAAKDYHYTKAEFKQFVQESRTIGVQVVPEIDVPAHAKSIADVFPEVRLRGKSQHSWNDHLDLSPEKYNDTLDIVKSIFDEYIDEDGFLGATTVDFGSDEYLDTSLFSQFQKFTKDMIEYMKGKGVTARLWGSMGNTPGVTAQVAEGVQMNIWAPGNSSPYANPTAMYNAGFSLLNTNGGTVYIVPGNEGRGGYKDYLDLTSVYGWTPNNIGGQWFPASSDQMLGGCLALWQDNIDTHSCGLDEVDVFDRFFDALPVIAVRQWGVENKTPARTLTELLEDVAKTGYAPSTNPANEVKLGRGASRYFDYNFTTAEDQSGNGRDLTLAGAALADGALELRGGESYADIGLDRLGWGNMLTFRVKKTSGGGTEQVIFEGNHAYGDFAIKALPVEGKTNVWKLGFSRELHDYEFDVELPVGEWVTLTLTNEQQSTKLSVDDGEPVAAVGKFVSKPDSNTLFRGKTGITNSSFELPMARIGSKSNAFVGLVDDVYAMSAATDTPLDNGEYDIPVEKYQAALDGNHHSGDAADKAIDEKANTVWHTEWNSVCPAADGWIQIELKETTAVSGLRYLPRNSGTNGIIKTFDILVSNDGTNWETVVTDGAFAGTSGWQIATFPAVETKFVRLLAKETLSDADYRFVSAAELRLCYAPDLSQAELTLAQESYPLVDGKAEPKPVVNLGGIMLVEERDYTLSYANNTAGGTATVTATGTGRYVGSAQVSFTVLPDARDLSGATVTLAQNSYPLVGGKAEPEPVVTLDGTRLTKGTDYTLTYADNTAAGTATVTVVGMGNYTGRVTVAFIVTGGSGGNTGDTGNTGSSGTAPSGRTEQEVRSDGSVLVTTTDRQTGTETGTAKYPDGTVVESVTTIGGVTTAKVTLAEGTQTATVIIPTAATPGIGQVAVITHPDGTREVIKTSLPTEEGLAITVSEDTRVKIIDNTKHFVDVPEGHWGEEAITFVTSREIFNGTGSGTFSPNGAMSRAMVCTVLANLEGVDVSGGETWYEKAVEWAKEQKVSDGSNPNALVTREQLVSILYRYAGSPATYRDLKGFTDADQVSSWAAIPMAWAIQKGIITGRSDGSLDPKTGASRAEVATVFQRYLMGAGK